MFAYLLTNLLTCQAESGVSKRVANFGSDLKDSEVYAHLLSRIDPERKCTTAILQQSADHLERAKYVAAQGPRMGAEFSLQPTDIVSWE